MRVLQASKRGVEVGEDPGMSESDYVGRGISLQSQMQEAIAEERCALGQLSHTHNTCSQMQAPAEGHLHSHIQHCSALSAT